MSSVSLVLIVLLALLVGVFSPMLVQLRATLKAMERRIQETGGRLDRVLDDAQIVAHRLARISRGFDGGEESLKDAMDAIRNLTATMNRLTSWTGIASTVGAAVGPAVASAVQAYRFSREDDELEPEGGPNLVGDEEATEERLVSLAAEKNNQAREKDRRRV